MRKRKLTKNLKINEQMDNMGDSGTFAALDAASGKMNKGSNKRNKLQ
ncbi:hypothetical protein N4T77_00320 [Clostridium sp. CX1]|uniref:Uncharacterized protein n=1 Tax=Clostridium tanneri TaxID=3037988 RepID=A0ABU4JWX3_9CLOT|nr:MULTISPECIES: hypothetical protein [unclassified Clostridium]MCT8975033.1 hypothetical protein [Clostridium sp. CX1]MDW8802617.1 hypothetical protein [Clostridium sp. A1-XYC3]